MPGPLKYYKTDPDTKGATKGRGAGYYYKRSPGKHSKYDVDRDKGYKQNSPRGVKRKRKSTHDTNPGNWGMTATVGSYIHTHDYNSPLTARRARRQYGDLSNEWNGKKSSGKLGGAIKAAKKAGNGNR